MKLIFNVGWWLEDSIDTYYSREKPVRVEWFRSWSIIYKSHRLDSNYHTYSIRVKDLRPQRQGYLQL